MGAPEFRRAIPPVSVTHNTWVDADDGKAVDAALAQHVPDRDQQLAGDDDQRLVAA